MPAVKPPAAGARDRGLRPALILAAHAVVFATLAWWSWRKWPDPLIDFGRELYIPWQITRGRVLYRDLASLFGPLSPYLNALWFRLFGTSLMTLAVCNLVIFALTVAGIYRLIRVSTDRVTASAASLSTLFLFGFSQYVAVGNYNFASPYSHEATHGMALSVALLVCLQQAAATRRRIFCGIGGVCFGLLILTKPDIALAAAAGVATAWIGAGLAGTSDRRDLRWRVPLFLASAALPPSLFFLYFAAHMQPGEALRAIAGAWTALPGTGIAESEFYLRGMGLDHPVANAIAMLQMFAAFLALVAAALVVSCTGVPAHARPSTIARLGRLALLVVAILSVRQGAWPRALPLITLAGLIAAALMFLRARNDREHALRLLSLVVWSAFALVLLAKMGLNARIVHYGFYLALPATSVAIVLTGWLIPQLIAMRYPPAAGRSFRQIALWTLAAAIVPYLALSNAWYRTKGLTVGSGADRFLASTAPGHRQGAAVLEAQQWLERSAPPGATLAVLPEGVMLNYLLRRDSPLRVINLMPPELQAFGEEGVRHSLEAAPPDFVLLVHEDVSEYGYPRFGTDPRYGLGILTWVKAHYRRGPVIGLDPMADPAGGIEIFEYGKEPWQVAPPR